MALIKQIVTLVNDSVKDAIGKTATLTELDSTDVVALGKAISSQEAFEKFYGALANRIVKTVYFVRSYERKNRNVLLDEHEYGAFIQKVYTEMPEAVENPSHEVTEIDGKGERSYSQQSPYDIENVIKVTAKTFGGQGTWAQEFIYSEEELATAFTSWDKMAALVDYIFVTADNAMKLELERLEATAVNTAMAAAIAGGKARNLLAEYNTLHPTNTLTVAQAMEDLDFLKFSIKEIKRTIENMGYMNTGFNVDGYPTFTSSENLSVELLSEYANVLESYLQADTYHKELVALPKFSKVSFWAGTGNDGTFPFSICSAINVKHADINGGVAVEQGGIIAFLHDTENVAAYFGRRRDYTKFNERSEVYIHMSKARKGYAVDNHANAFVFYIADTAEVSDETAKEADTADKD